MDKTPQTATFSRSIAPQGITDRSYLDGMIEMLQTTIPSSYSQPALDRTDPVYWVKFLEADVNDPLLLEHTETDSLLPQRPLLFALGHSHAVVVFLILVTKGEAQEVFSLEGAYTHVFDVLKTPKHPSTDQFNDHRPLVVVNEANRNDILRFLSLATGEEVHELNCKTEVLSLFSNERIIAVTLYDKIITIDADTFQPRFWVKTYPKPESALANPIALGDRWLAYSDTRVYEKFRSRGGNRQESGQSYTATFLDAAKTMGTALGEQWGRLTGTNTHPEADMSSSPSHRRSSPPDPGVLSVVDLECAWGEREQQVEIGRLVDGRGVVAHFRAHASPLAAMKFDQSGQLLVTCCVEGRVFNVFSIQPHPCDPSECQVQHLYMLYRGETISIVQDLHFSTDSRWVTVSTLRGTAHTFPITPYGGQISVRTHTEPLVANKLSRFHTTAGLDEVNLVSKSDSDVTITPDMLLAPWASSSGCALTKPVRVESLAIKPPLSSHRSPDKKPATASKPPHRLFRPQEGGACLNAYFGTALSRPRSASGGSCTLAEPAVCESLYLLTGSGCLLEHKLTPTPVPPVKGVVCQESPVLLKVQGLSEWCLARDRDSPAFEPPLSKHSPLLVTSCIMRDLLLAHCDLGESRQELQIPIEPVKSKEWLTNVELVTYAPPGRRLWMGPQFCFKTFKRPPSIDYSTLVYSSSPRSNASEEGDRYAPPLIDLVYDDVTETSSLPLHVRHSDPMPTSSRPEGWPSAEGTPNEDLLEVYGSWKDYQPTAGLSEMNIVRDLISDAMEFEERNPMTRTMYQSTRTDSPLTASTSPDAITDSMHSLDDRSTPMSDLFGSDH